MTSSALSERTEPCPKCQRPMVWKFAHKYPVIENLLFGGSFVAFLFLYSKLLQHVTWIWAWCAVQFILGVLLARGRIRAKKRVLRCISCDAALP